MDADSDREQIDLTDFVCRRCGECCRWEGDVRLLQEEIAVIAGFLGLSVDRFIDEYTRLAHDRKCLSLIESGQGYCIFLEEGIGCRINEVKPRQCRDFPFFWRCDGLYRRCAGMRTLCREVMLPGSESLP